MGASFHSGTAATDTNESARRPRRRPGENRARLVEAGIRVFGIQGFHGASTSTIAELAEVPQPHVYANFTTKQELFLACGQRVLELLADNAADDEEETRLSAFLLQCLAASHEPKLQPALSDLLDRANGALGEARILELIEHLAAGQLRTAQQRVHSEEAERSPAEELPAN